MWHLARTPFRVTRHGEPISLLPLNQTVNTGVRYSAIVPGLVPEIEERDAGRFNGYTWHEWRTLHYAERVDNIAYYRLSRLIDMHKEDAVATETRRKSRLPAR